MIDLNKATILIVDDAENMFHSLRSVLKLLGFGKQYLYAENGEKALKVFRERVIDLALVDNNMPIMTGEELIEIMRQDDDLKNIPVIMITGNAKKEFVANVAESEIDAYILKPVTVKLLSDKIPQVIEKANHPCAMTIHLNNADKKARNGDFDGAIEDALLAKSANPKASKPLREIGGYCIKKGDLDEAAKYFLQAVQINSVDVVAFQYLGDIFLRKGDVDNALKYLNKAMQISPRNLERGLNLGKILLKKKMVDKAMLIYNKIFHLSKEPNILKEQVVGFCIEVEAVSYAIKLLNELIARDGKRPDLLFKLGVLFENKGEGAKALIQFNEALLMDKDNIDIMLHQARVYLDQGLLLRAEKPLKVILKMNPDHKEAKKLLRKCF